LALSNALGDSDSKVVTWAALALTYLDPDNPLVLPTLLDLLRRDDDWFRVQAICGIRKLGPRARPCLKVLIATLDDPSPRVRREVPSAIAMIGKDGKAAVGPLVSAAKRYGNDVCLFSIEALGKIGRDAREAAPFVGTFLRNPHSDFRCAAIRALGNMGEASP